MTRTLWWLSLVAVTMPAAAVLSAAEAPPPPAAPAAPAAPASPAPAAAAPASPSPAAPVARPALDGELLAMVNECRLTPDQQTQLLDLAQSVQAEAAAWESANVQRVAALQQAGRAAQQAQDQAAFERVKADAQPLMQERLALAVKHQKALLGILSPEQKDTWIGYMIHRQMMSSLQVLSPTQEQTSKIRQLCDAAAKEVNDLKLEELEAAASAAQKPGAKPEDAQKARDAFTDGLKARSAIAEKLRVAVKDTVLTPEQKAALEKLTTPPPGAGAVPPPAAPAPAPPVGY